MLRRPSGRSVTASDFGTVASASGAVATALAQPLVRHLQRLNQIRRAVPALQMGHFQTDGISGGMAFKRHCTNGRTEGFALVTVTGAAGFTGIPNGTYKDAVTGDGKTVSNVSLSVAAPGKGNLRVYVLNGPGKVGADEHNLN